MLFKANVGNPFLERVFVESAFADKMLGAPCDYVGETGFACAIATNDRPFLIRLDGPIEAFKNRIDSIGQGYIFQCQNGRRAYSFDIMVLVAVWSRRRARVQC